MHKQRLYHGWRGLSGTVDEVARRLARAHNYLVNNLFYHGSCQSYSELADADAGKAAELLREAHAEVAKLWPFYERLHAIAKQLERLEPHKEEPKLQDRMA